MYTNMEMADMHFVYGLADGNATEARRIYQEKYPQRPIPCAKTFSNIHRRLQETGTFSKSVDIPGKPRAVRTPELEEAVLNEVSIHPETSTRKMSDMFNVSHQTVLRILKDQQLYPYHIQRVQALLPADFPKRLNFCEWLLQKITENNQFLNFILFTDEANFSRNSIQNFHNNHLWAQENPHAITEVHHQHQFSLNVWAGIIGDFLIGPFFLPPRLDGNIYRYFIEHELPALLEDIPIIMRNQLWFMHDGAPAHFSRTAREYLDRVYEGRWIGRGAVEPHQSWPPRSPELNPLDYFLWGHLKTLVYSTPIQDIDHLRNRIIDSCDLIRRTPGLFGRVRESMVRRLEGCIMANGGHFQQLI